MAHARSPALTQVPAELHPEQRLTLPQVLTLRGESKSQFYESLRRGEASPPIVKSGRFVRWRAGDVLSDLARDRQP